MGLFKWKFQTRHEVVEQVHRILHYLGHNQHHVTPENLNRYGKLMLKLSRELKRLEKDHEKAKKAHAAKETKEHASSPHHVHHR
jgi:hypothetical protein